MNNVLNFLNNLNINKEEYIIVACSGGPDSMFLIDLLHRLNYKIVCAHVNHKVRKESDDEYKFVNDYCIKNDIIFEGTELTGYTTGNFEHFARNFRYSFFESLINKYHTKYLFTAHHGDDLVETILMRLVRGSSLKGYSGFSIISSKNGYKIVRPLIYLTKEMIENYNSEHNIKYSIDSTNNEDDYTRNRFRHYVLPFLKNEETLVHEKFILFNNEINDACIFIDSLVISQVSKMYKDNSLHLDLFNEVDEYLQRRILENIISKLYPDNLYLVDKNHINEIMKIIISKKPNISLTLPNNISVMKEYNKLLFNAQTNLDNNYEYLYYDGLEINDYVFKEEKSDDKSNYVIRLNSKNIALPLKVRTRKNGDKMRVKNMSGTKKINDIFIDLKVNLEKRDAWPLLVDANNEILWLPGLKKSEFDIPIKQEYDIIITYEKKERNLNE